MSRKVLMLFRSGIGLPIEVFEHKELGGILCGCSEVTMACNAQSN